METECEIVPCAQLSDTVKDITGTSEVSAALVAQYFEDDANLLAQTNGVHHGDTIAYEATEETTSATVITRENYASDILHEAIERAALTDLEETAELESEHTKEIDESGYELPSERNDNPNVLVENADDPNSCMELKNDENVQVEIETYKEEVSEESSLQAGPTVTVERGNADADGYDMELHVIMDPAASNSELAELAEATGDHHTADLLNQLQRHNTEFSDAMHAQASMDSGDNNFETQEQVLNKKELLDILEGNEPEVETKTTNSEDVDEFERVDEIPEHNEQKIAMEQLSNLARVKGKRSVAHSSSNKRIKKSNKNMKPPRRTRSNASQKFLKTTVLTDTPEQLLELSKLEEIERETSSDLKPADQEPAETSQSSKSKDLIKVLVEDWDDDEVTKEEVIENQCHAPDTVDSDPKQLNSQFQDPDPHKSDTKITVLNQTQAEAITSKSTPPQRRMSRVIKKKVIFDPDNPDTFTRKKSPSVTKAKSPSSEAEQKENPPAKKIKTEATPQKTKEKSPPTKSKSATQWKKPPPKNNKHKKKLTEVDRLLMDEGAVNMMYQLNSSGEAELPKGKKSIRSKATFIKKFGLTPEAKDIKFRERRKEPPKSEEMSARRSRASANAPGASPAPCDSFETHSADDSVIIRRHSSSSYSSSCLSPRRLSDIDLPTAAASATRASPPPTSDKFNDVFMSSAPEPAKVEVLDKKDCLTLKEKLNSKLSRVLNFKRKREGKTDRVESKQKKKSKERINLEVRSNTLPDFKKLSLNFEKRVAEVNILKEESGNNIYDIDTLKELKQALEYIDGREDVSVTLLLSQSGNLCGGLSLQTVYSADKKHKAASEAANAVRSLFVCMEQHGKFVCAGVEGACVGVGLALLALCDVVVASDRATFSLLACDGAIVPGTCVLTSHRKSLCRSLITEMLVFGRQLSATEAMSRGLVSRTLWPDRFSPELKAMVRDIAAQPPSALQLKKRLLGLRNNVEPKSTFLSCLDAERDLLTAYWSSAEFTSPMPSATD